MPGRTPTAVPSTTPIKAYRRLIGCSATSMPWASAENVSIAPSQQPFEGPGRQAQRQQLVEQQKEEDAEAQSDREIDEKSAPAEGRRRGGKQDCRCRNEPIAKADQRNECRQ